MKSSHPQPMQNLVRAIATIAAVLLTIVVNLLSNFFPPSGLNIGQVANDILGDVRILPASYAFAIWGLIYLGLIAYCVYQFLPTQQQDPDLRWADYWLILASLVQIAWVVLFIYQQFWWSVLAILVILGALIAGYLQLDVGRKRVSRQRKWAANIPFSVYLGWISIATMLNIASALYMSGWQGGPLSPELWTALLLVVGVAIGAIAILQRGDIALPLVFVWAYVAIAFRQSDAPLIWVTAVVGAIALSGLVAFDRYSHRSLRSSSS